MTIEELTTFEKLNNAFYQSAKISGWKESTQRYQSALLVNNLKLQEELRNGTYRASGTNNFYLLERGKLRKIEAPCIRDRIVQKILCHYVLLPNVRNYLIYDNYASLKNRGTSFARKRTDVLLRKYIREHGSDGYVLQIDIKKYFESIDHSVLKEMLHSRIHESKEIMDLIDYVVDTSSSSNKGLNLGSEAPQIFAIYYLNGIDNYIKTVKGMKYYGRYMDDMLIIHEDKQALEQLLKEIECLMAELKLETNKKKTHITKLSDGFTFLQVKYTIKDGKIIKRPTHVKIARERKRLKKYKALHDQGILTIPEIECCYKSWRNSILKDCNCANTSIKALDDLYNTLFPGKTENPKVSRNKMINNAYKGMREILYEDMYG